MFAGHRRLVTCAVATAMLVAGCSSGAKQSTPTTTPTALPGPGRVTVSSSPISPFSPLARRVPDVVGMSGPRAAGELSERRYVLTATGARCCIGTTVVGQSPSPGTVVGEGTIVTVHLSAEPGVNALPKGVNACPKTSSGRETVPSDKANAGVAGLGTELVPISVRYVRICGDPGDGTHPDVVLSGSAATRFTADTNRQTSRQNPTTCPGGEPSFVITFADDEHHVSLDDTCNELANGTIAALASPEWVTELNQYTGLSISIPDVSTGAESGAPTGPAG